MGYPMAGHVRSRGGHTVTVYNRDGAKSAAWVKEFGGTAAAAAALAVKAAEYVFCCVGNDYDLRSVTLAEGGAFDTMDRGPCSSTTRPHLPAWRANSTRWRSHGT